MTVSTNPIIMLALGSVQAYVLLYFVAVMQAMNVGQVPMPWHVRRAMWDGISAIARLVCRKKTLGLQMNPFELLELDPTEVSMDALNVTAEVYYRGQILPQWWFYSDSQRLVFRAMWARAQGTLNFRNEVHRAGHAAWSEHVAASQPWRAVLGVSVNLNDPVELRKVYRKLAKKHHPDLGGDAAKMRDINEAFQQAQADLNFS